MRGDIIIIKPEHIKKAELVAEYLAKKYNDGAFVVGLAGVSGIGKTEVAKVAQKILFEKYKIGAKLIHLDDYYMVHWKIRNKIRKEKGISSVGQKEMNWRKLHKIIRNYQKGKKKLYLQQIHPYIECIERIVCETKKMQILIFEGLYGCYIKDANIRVYLDGNINDTLEFRKERQKENPNDEFRKRVVEQEQRCIVQSKRYADLVIPFEVKDEKIH